MKTFVTILAAFNTLPLGLWVFTVLPLVQIARQGITAPTPLAQFCGYGFIWGALLYPAFLLFNHYCFIQNYRREAYRPALYNQIYTTVYLLFLLTYGLITFG
ncbi:hypothetical protein QEH56_22500 [Pelagicoccus enzymogenes]|uniref:hypothetical protein n=1 Tax=Pelagicoccus enzymogenes TaxID=2773457 RepID=UPI00280E4A99|nr:hypothetical protein [Pelagicoccus enzymogenes]MDQ8200955.1 hypothetical protein [Pelagicoccus enzymogenes]